MARTPAPRRPEPPESDHYREQYGVIVICVDEAHQRQVFETLEQYGWRLKVVVT